MNRTQRHGRLLILIFGSAVKVSHTCTWTLALLRPGSTNLENTNQA
jgi:hypothetical protein